MSLRCPNLPLLPGNTFNPLIGQTKFHKSQHFELIKGVPALSDRVYHSCTDASRYPSIYARGEVAELPSWIAFDKQILRFDAYFQETMQEVYGSPFQIRKVVIYFYLEDGTVLVSEPKVENSGLSQGTLISRQRIPFPKPMDDKSYDIVDFNIGREVELYGRIFKITNCDKFTRTFLNRLGISVPDPINTPIDPYAHRRVHEKDGNLPKKPNKTVDTFGQFLKHDRQVLRFKGYWDDQDSEFGILHRLDIYYFLADDTIEIKEIIPPNSGRDTGFMFIKRGKIPKIFEKLPGPGDIVPSTILNVFGDLAKGRYVVDALNTGYDPPDYYKDCDLSIGGVVNVFGRKIVLTSCDPYTKEYYRNKYGLDSFEEYPEPMDEHKIDCRPIKERELPPWNGYGTHEDSAQNCVTVELKPVWKDFKKFLKNDKEGLDSKCLRYLAKMISKTRENCTRTFIINFFLSDDTIKIQEIAGDNAGFPSKVFLKRTEVIKPGQPTYTSKPPEIFTAKDLFVGATLIINGYTFVLIDADEYALRYLELHAQEFPKSNIQIIMGKVREAVRPVYKDFVAENLPIGDEATISYETLKMKLCRIMGDQLTEHEMLTIARYFSAACMDPKYDRESIRAVTLTELKRFLWDDLVRFTEYFLKRDPLRTGLLTRHDCYTIIRACRLPLEKELIEKILDVMRKDQNCNIYYQDLLQFLDRNICPLADTKPINCKSEFLFTSEIEPRYGSIINWCAFNKCLNLEKELTQKLDAEAHKQVQVAH